MPNWYCRMVSAWAPVAGSGLASSVASVPARTTCWKREVLRKKFVFMTQLTELWSRPINMQCFSVAAKPDQGHLGRGFCLRLPANSRMLTAV